jgi:hypothetical protein
MLMIRNTKNSPMAVSMIASGIQYLLGLDVFPIKAAGKIPKSVG